MEQIKDFLRRNAPVFAIGGILLLSFLLVIYLSQNQETPAEEPELVVVEEEDQNELEFRSNEDLTAIDIKELSPEEVERVLETYGKDEGQYARPFSLLPGNPADEAIRKTREDFDELSRLKEDQVKNNFGDIVIRYTENGFEPKSPRVFMYQNVIWINETEDAIAIRQLTKKFDEWEDAPKVLGPGQQLEYQIPETTMGNWAYEEATSRDYATLRIERAYIYELN